MENKNNKYFTPKTMFHNSLQLKNKKENPEQKRLKFNKI